jgi:hypothetical protein
VQPVSPCRGLGRGGVVAIAPALAGPERHGSLAIGAKADAGKEGGAADDTGERDLGIARAQVCLHSVEGRLVDQRRDLDGHHFVCRIQFLGLAALVELVAADIGWTGQNAMNLSDSPTPALPRTSTRPSALPPSSAIGYESQP